MSELSIDPQELLAHRAFVAAVARRALAGEDLVDDVVQDTYVAALEKRPPSRVPLRAWLAGIARNVAFATRRRDARRRARERAVARPETDAAADRLRWQRRVVDAVLALDRPYRDAVLLRYYEDLPPREVAARLDIPVNTVRTRLRRALRRLRAELDGGPGGRRAWALALVPAVATPVGAPVGLTVAALVALAAGVVLVARPVLAPDPVVTVTTARTEPVAAPSGPQARLVTWTKPPAPLYRGRVVDLQRAPVAGVRVHAGRYREQGHVSGPLYAASAPTDALGAFEIALTQRASTVLYVEGAGRWAGPYYVDPADDLRIEWDPGPALRFGPAAAGGELVLRPPPEPDAFAPTPPFARVRLDEAGAARVPAWPTHVVRAAATLTSGGERWHTTLPRTDQDVPFGVGHRVTARTVVLDPDGAPAAGVDVHVWFTWSGYAGVEDPVPVGGTEHFFARVPEDGVLRWNVLAPRPETVSIVAGGFVARDGRTGLPRPVYPACRDWRREIDGATLELPALVLHEEKPGRSVLVELPRRDPPAAGRVRARRNGELVRAGGAGPEQFGRETFGGRRLWRFWPYVPPGMDGVELELIWPGAFVRVLVDGDAFEEAVAHRRVLVIPPPDPLPRAEVRVRRPDGSPAAGVRVTIRSFDAPPALQAGLAMVAVADRAGVARLPVIAGCAYEAVAVAADGGAGVAPLGETVVLRAPRPVRFRCVDAEGRPVPRPAAALQARHPELGRIAVHGDDDGFVELPPVVPEFFRLSVGGVAVPLDEVGDVVTLPGAAPSPTARR